MKWTPSTRDANTGKRRMIRWVLGAILVAGVALAIGEWVRPQIAPPPSPTTAPSGQAAPFATVREGLALSKVEQGHYDVAFTRERQLDESAMTMWMQRVRRLPQLSRAQQKEMEQPSVQSLRTEPERYKGRAVRLTVHPLQVWRWEPHKNFVATQWWGVGDGSIWRINAIDASAAKPETRPLILLCAFDPATVLGKPKKIGDRGEGLYPIAKPHEIVGVFYKRHQVNDRTGKLGEFPVVMVWQMRREGLGIEITPWGNPKHTVILGMILVLVFGYIFLRSKLRPKRGQVPSHLGTPRYQPLREPAPRAEGEKKQVPAPSPGDAPPGGGPPGGGPEDDGGDSQLKAAAEQFRKGQETDDDGTDRNG